MDEINTERESLLVSILIFSGTENIDRLMENFPNQISSACASLNISANVVIRKNNPKLDTVKLESTLNNLNELSSDIIFTLVDDNVNSGFGRGHNLNYRQFPSDYLFILNDDLDMPHLDWMRVAIPRLRAESKLAMIGDSSNPNGINPFFGNGTFPDQHRNFSLRYAEASVLLVSGIAFEKIGMFDETIDWAMGEDSDLSFKAQQAGYYIDWMPMPHRHFRSTSFNSLPQYQKSSVLEHNRARLLAKWGNSFSTGKPGKYEVIDVFSDGLGDMFCALMHIRAEYDRLPRSMHDHIYVNVGSEALARAVLPSHSNISTERDINVLRAKLGSDEIASIRSSRTLNYALPYNIHALVAGALSLPFAGAETLDSVAGALKSILPSRKIDGDYCVVHLEFDRPGHHGRGPSASVIRSILSNLGAVDCKLIIVGKNEIITAPDLRDTTLEVVDLQGKSDLLELISLVANAKFFVGIDSFPFHVAQAAGVPSAVFFGSVNPALRVLHQEKVWPITADIDCLGCYHDQIEPGAPFCMRMTEQCTYDVSTQRILRAIEGMVTKQLYDWSTLHTLLNRKIARFVEFQKFHPTSRTQLHDTMVPNQQVSELIYELTDRISQTYGRQLSGPYMSQLKDENTRMRALLSDAQTKVSSYEALETFVPRTEEKITSIPADELIVRRIRCSASQDGGEIVVNSIAADPQIEFVPIKLSGSRFGISITARSYPPSELKLYWRVGREGYSEQNTFIMPSTEHPNSRVWWYTGRTDQPIYIRLDPIEGVGKAKLMIRFMGDLDSENIKKSVNASCKPTIAKYLLGFLKR